MNTPVVLITGALSGIGRATAIAYAKEGVRIVVSGRREEAGNALAAELQAMGAQAEFVRADVRFEADVQNLVAKTVARFGRLDIAINNAGTEGRLGPITEQSVEDYENTFASNVLGTLLAVKHEVQVMQTQGSGSIVNLSSIAGKVGIAGASVYVASEHAIEGITKSAALEGAAIGIRVNAVAPGPVATDMLDRFVDSNEEAKARFLDSMPAKRAAEVDEIVQTILFIAGNKARYLTGQSIAVDGGYTAQ
ncbi:SDR family NAD(P)-dependent oxidoreductase [Dyella humi]|uniref:SDR family oxidoreductase n=1 Tax=Dyella humi TaxID=1770547 RepID=A0ABW8IH05_9GAMM